ncbi:hypothetical protein HJG60_011844 [Phyllostomus discolor]|uniref:Uncharacterized protein n=1 Tax=Phyllostomus discolor TaxID=89673 RepID=A0A834DVZ7_9CHIR|nr:hypothetical protein HJG60_011844 [Phyllostomus discolor]
MKFESFIVDLFLPPHAPRVNRLSTGMRMLGTVGHCLMEVAVPSLHSWLFVPSTWEELQGRDTRVCQEVGVTCCNGSVCHGKNRKKQKNWKDPKCSSVGHWVNTGMCSCRGLLHGSQAQRQPHVGMRMKPLVRRAHYRRTHPLGFHFREGQNQAVFTWSMEETHGNDEQVHCHPWRCRGPSPGAACRRTGGGRCSAAAAVLCLLLFVCSLLIKFQVKGTGFGEGSA